LIYTQMKALLTFFCLLSSVLSSKLISTHLYSNELSEINKYPPFCGAIPKGVNLNYITAVQNLDKKDCFSCLKVSNQLTNQSVYVTVVDSGGNNLDLCNYAFIQLFGTDSGTFNAAWEYVDTSYCK
ncbi:hypothetical protein K502DRAFT_295705, partial [Neoconidiobolus thromboides FSU 785]